MPIDLYFQMIMFAGKGKLGFDLYSWLLLNITEDKLIE
jgi:hypothetical protein